MIKLCINKQLENTVGSSLFILCFLTKIMFSAGAHQTRWRPHGERRRSVVTAFRRFAGVIIASALIQKWKLTLTRRSGAAVSTADSHQRVPWFPSSAVWCLFPPSSACVSPRYSGFLPGPDASRNKNGSAEDQCVFKIHTKVLSSSKIGLKLHRKPKCSNFSPLYKRDFFCSNHLRNCRICYYLYHANLLGTFLG